MRKIWVAAAAGFLALAVFGVAGANADHVVISQVQVEGDNATSSASDEFIELYNPTLADVVIGGWSVQYNSSSGGFPVKNKKDIPAGTCLASGGYFLLSGSGYNNSVVADLTYNSSLSLSGSPAGATIFLANSGTFISSATDPVIVDKLGYGTSASNTPDGSAALVPKLLGSQEKALVRESYSGDNSVDFKILDSNPHNSSLTPCEQLQSPPNPAPTSTLPSATTTYPTGITISEILPNPAGVDDGQEAVELYNAATSTVDLSGWLLSDDHGVGTAYRLPTSTEISAGGYLVIVIPPGIFTLTNTGDTLNLYYPDSSLADHQSYTDAPEGKGWQVVDGAWLWAPPTLGGANAAPLPVQQSFVGGGSVGGAANYVFVSHATSVILSEFLVNPIGDNAGKQWVELYNTASATTSLTGWKLDDQGVAAVPGGTAYALPSGTLIAPAGFLQVAIPSGKFLLNTVGDTLRLFRPDDSLAQDVNFTQAPEAQSYSLGRDGLWSFGAPTPGERNAVDQPLPEIFISELLPNPAGDDQEFIELYNPSTSTPVDLKGFKLLLGSREKIFDEAVLATSSYLTLYEDDLPVKLRDAGQIVKLLDNLGRPVSVASYDKSLNGQSFAWTGSGYNWTEQPTPGEDNRMILAASTLEPANLQPAAVKSSAAKTPAGVTSTKADKQLQQQVADLQTQLADLRQQLALVQPGVSPAQTGSGQLSDPAPVAPDRASSLALILSALALLVLLFQHFWPKSPKV